MIVRYGFYHGFVEPAHIETFDRHFDREVVPLLAAFPGLLSVRLLRGHRKAGLPPRFHHLIEIAFPDEPSMMEAMRSPERRAAMAAQARIMHLYHGTTPHANFELAGGVDAAHSGRSSQR
jgi:uncharacterized protein (TIGR02118 family)